MLDEINPDQLEGRIIFMPMLNVIDWTQHGTSSAGILNANEASDNAKEFQRGHWPFFGPGMKKNGMERATTSQKENGTSKPIK